jgi:hypothetical protein
MTGPPDQLTERPAREAKQIVDALSEVLQTVRLTGGVFLEARFTAPWCIASHITPHDCQPLLNEPRQVIAYHYVTRGRLEVRVEGGQPIEASAGEAVLLPRNDPTSWGAPSPCRRRTATTWFALARTAG